jgi:hypothetical protein
MQIVPFAGENYIDATNSVLTRDLALQLERLESSGC